MATVTITLTDLHDPMDPNRIGISMEFNPVLDTDSGTPAQRAAIAMLSAFNESLGDD